MPSLRSTASRSLVLCLVLTIGAGLLGCGLAAFTLGYDLSEQRVAGSPLGGVLPLELSIPLAVDLVQYLREGARMTASARGTVPPDDVTYTGHLDFAVEVL